MAGPLLLLPTMSKAEIFDLFYGPQKASRSGGGKVKTVIGRKRPTFLAMQALRARIQDDAALLAYFDGLRDRDPQIAPPQRPAETTG